jgi:hypothetical protein
MTTHLKPEFASAFLEAVGALVITLICALVLTSVFERKLPPVVFGPTAFSETTELQPRSPPAPPPPPTPPSPPLPNPTFSVFFANGAADVPSNEKPLLIMLATGVTECTTLHLYVLGSASSLSYLNDPKDAKNVELANNRARNVAKYLHEINHRLDATSVPVQAVQRRYDDRRAMAARERTTELLNRRADIFIDDSDCRFPVATEAMTWNEAPLVLPPNG